MAACRGRDVAESTLHLHSNCVLCAEVISLRDNVLAKATWSRVSLGVLTGGRVVDRLNMLQCAGVCVYVCAGVYVCASVCAGVYVCASVCAGVYVCMCVQVCMCLCAGDMHVCMYVCMYACMCVCVCRCV